MARIEDTSTVFPGAKNYIKGTADKTPFTLRETVIGGQTVQVKVYESLVEYDDSYDPTEGVVDADLITGIENTEH